MHDTPNDNLDELPERPWIDLKTTYDVEAWIDSYNRDLQQVIGNAGNIANQRLNGQGICFHLAYGGDIYLHTTSEGDVLLDVTPEAEWAAPVIAAATGTEAPGIQIWALPGHTLTQLVLGLSSLIASTRIVRKHDFRMKKSWK